MGQVRTIYLEVSPVARSERNTTSFGITAEKSACNEGDVAGAMGSIPGLGRSLGEGNG